MLMKVTQKLIIEALVVGLGLMILWYVMNMVDQNVWKKNMLVSMFITGAVFHLIAEFSGVNKWYCRNGNACSV